MKTVCDLISPVSLFVNSAVTKSGCAYVMSRSLQSAIEYLGGSKRWSRNESDIVPWKSSIGEISSKISSKPDFEGSSPRLVLVDSARRERHKSLPNNQSTLSTCSASRLGTSRGSRIFANEIRRGAVELFFAAKRCPFRQVHKNVDTHI